MSNPRPTPSEGNLPSDLGTGRRVAARLPLLSAAAAAALGAIVLTGWAARLPLLTAFAPDAPATQPWAAVLLVLGGTALAAHGGRPSAAIRLAGRAATVLLALAGGLFLLEALFEWDAGLDLLLFAEAVRSQPVLPPHPGRMVPGVAASWMLLAAALTTAKAHGKWSRAIFTAAASGLLAFGAVSLLVHVFGAGGARGVAGLGNPAAPTALGLTLLGAGVLALRPDVGWVRLLTGPSVGAQAARRLGPLIVVLPVVAGILAQQGQNAGLYSQDFLLALTTFLTSALMLAVTLWAARRLNGLEALRRAERERAETEARLRIAIEAGRLGAWSYDARGRTVTWDARTRELLGLGDEPSGPIERFLAAIHPDDRQQVSEIGERALDPASGGRYEVEHRVVRPDGTVAWLAQDGHVTFAPDGRVTSAVGVTTDITARKQAELRQRLLVHELNHRVKNTLATVQAIAVQSLRDGGDMEGAQRRFTERLLALSKAHDILTQESWESADLQEVLAAAVLPFQGDAPGRFLLDGCTLRLSPKAALSVALALHELGTNAVKYGALTRAEGRVAIRCRTHGDRWTLEWRESGGPQVRPPERRGFGSRLIERGLAAELGAEVRIVYDPAGVVCTIDAPIGAARG